MTNPFLGKRPRISTARNKKGMSMSDMIAYGIRYEPDKSNSKYVGIRNITPIDRTGRKTSAVYARTRTFDPETTPPYRTHYQYIYPADPTYRGRLSECPSLKFSCSCPRFLYMWEYALYRQGASDLYFGNGQPPRETNRRMIPSICKHGIVVLKQLRRNKL